MEDASKSWRIIRPLGSGGMSTVWEIETAFGERRALKRFSVDHGNIAFLRERFVAEGRVLMRLSHLCLVHVYASGVDVDDRPYLVMDLVLDAHGESTTLEALRAASRVTEEKAECFYDDLVAALRYCHAQGVVHRDVKLNNILINAEGHAVLSDFGVSRIVDANLREELRLVTTFVTGETTGTRPVMGTYWYLAPELRKGDEATAASDWYALGVTFFRLLTGLWYEPGTDAFELLAAFAPHWRKRLERLLSEDPTRRTPEVGQVPVQRFTVMGEGHYDSCACFDRLSWRMDCRTEPGAWTG